MAYLSIAFAAILWSTGGVLIKTIDWNPMAISAVRSGIAILVIAAFYRSRTYKLTWSSIFGAASYAACLITFVSATKFTTAANAIFLQYSAPVFVAIMSGVVLKENVRREQWLCIIWALCGLGVFFLDDLDTKGTFGNILGLLSGISFAAMIVFLRKERVGEPLGIVFYGNILVFLIGVPFCFDGNAFNANWLVLITLGVFQLALPYIIYARAIKSVRAAEAVVIQTLEPVLNPVWVAIAIGELPGPYGILGGVLVLGAVTAQGVLGARRHLTLKKT